MLKPIVRGVTKLMQLAIAELLTSLKKEHPGIFKEMMKEAGLTEVKEEVK